MAKLGEYFDDLETRSIDEREAAHLSKLPSQISNAKSNAPFFSKLLNKISAEDVISREALAELPITRKSDLIELQKNNPPLLSFK